MTRIEKRNIATAVILSIITFGIYGIYWDVKLAKDAVSVKDENDDGLVEILLMIFLPFLGLYLAEKKFAEGCQMKGYIKDDRSIIYLVLGIVGLGIVGVCLMQSDLNDYVTALENGFIPAAPGAGNNAYGAGNAYGNNSYGASGAYGNNAYGANNAYDQNAKNEIYNQLQQYKALLDQGIISPEEFEAKKNELLKML